METYADKLSRLGEVLMRRDKTVKDLQAVIRELLDFVKTLVGDIVRMSEE